MIVIEVLDQPQLDAVRQGLEVAPFRDGRATAGPAAEQVKFNEQARGDDPGVIELARRMRFALEAHPTFRSLVRPARWSNLMFSRYGPGQQLSLIHI